MQNLINYFKRWTQENVDMRDETKPYTIPPPSTSVSSTPQWYVKRSSKIETQELHKHIDLAG